jgi:hypothetical protein
MLLCGGKWLLVDTLLLQPVTEERLAAHWPVLNVQLLVALTLASGALLMTRLTKASSGADSKLALFASFIAPAACVFVLTALTFEIDRALVRALAGREPLLFLRLWGRSHARFLLALALWSCGGAGMLLLGQRRAIPALARTGALLVLLASLAWLTFGTVLPRFETLVPATPIANLQFATGVLLIALLLLVAREARAAASLPPEIQLLNGRFAAPAMRILLGAIGLWLGSLEIDRLCAEFANANMVRQMGLSIYWGLYGIGLVALGFWRWTAWMRYAGLALLAITLFKVLIVDMAEVRYVYRVLSLLGVGGLLMLTSIAYAKLSSKLQSRPGAS